LKTTEWQKRRTFIVILALTAAGFVVWIAVLLGVWDSCGCGVSAEFWPCRALSTALAAAGLFGAGSWPTRAGRGRQHRHMEVADRLFAELNSPENIRARRWVFLHLPDDPSKVLLRWMRTDAMP